MIVSMKNNIFGQISVVEMAFVIMLFSIAMVNVVTFENSGASVDYKFQIQSALDTIYYDSNFRDIILGENLASPSLTENWSGINDSLHLLFVNYEIEIANSTVSKLIFSCDAQYNKFYDERVIAIKNASYFEFRKLKLGVCY